LGVSPALVTTLAEKEVARLFAFCTAQNLQLCFGGTTNLFSGKSLTLRSKDNPRFKLPFYFDNFC
jgi:hypothetical protein